MPASSLVLMAHTYADAFLAVVTRAQAGEAVSQQAQKILAKLAKDTLLRATLRNPTLSKNQRLVLCQSLWPPEAHFLWHNLAQTLLRYNRLNLLAEVIRAYVVLQTLQDGAVPLRVITAAPLSTKERATLVHQLEATLKAPVLAHYYVAPHLGGGMKIYMGSYLLDQSWSHRLNTMMHHLERGFL